MKIFIPTVGRSENQITYENLPDELKKQVVFVIQAWERDHYAYDAEYMILPDHIHVNKPKAIAQTRLEIYKAGQSMKYAVLDDDLTFKRRNSKYWSNINNMEKSKRDCTPEEVLEMFNLYDRWLDEVTVCGCGHVENPPSGSWYSENTSLSSCYWINGKDFSEFLPSIEKDLVSVSVAEDLVFLLSLLSNGYKNRASQEFLFFNNSVHTKLQSDLWDQRTFESVHEDHKKIEKMFPGLFEILYDKNGDRVKGGFRNFGKTRVSYNKAYKQFIKNKNVATLDKFFE